MKDKTSLVLLLLLVFSLFTVFNFTLHTVVAQAHYVGRTSTSGVGGITCGDKILGSEFTCYANGSVSNITAYMYSSTPTGARCAIFFDNETLLANTTETTISGGSLAWFNFNFSASVDLVAGTDYIFAVWANGTGATPYVGYGTGSTNQYWYNASVTYNATGAFPSESLTNSGTNEICIYVTLVEDDEYNYYFYGLFDEDTGEMYDADERAVNVTAYWDDGTDPYTFEVNETGYIGFSSSPLYFFFELGTVDREYWLSAEEGDDTTTLIYIFNATSLTSYTLTFLDTTGALSTYSWVSASRPINGSDVVVDKRKVDEQNKIVTSLVMYRKYVITVEAVAGTTYTWGDLAVDADVYIDLTVNGLDFPSEIALTYRYIRVYGYRQNYNSTHDSIVHLYEDTKENTNYVNITIYNENDTLVHSYRYNLTDSFTYTWSEADNETSYYSVVTINHGDYGTMTFRQTFIRGYDDSPFDLDFLGTLPNNVEVSTLLPSGILLIGALVFSSLTAGIGGIVIVAMAVFINLFGWMSFDINLLVFTGIMAIIYAVLKNFRRVTER